MRVVRPTSFALGILILAALWLGPLPHMASHRFSAHMTMHMGVVALAAPLIGIGLGGARWESRYLASLLNPVAASVFELLVVWGWHAPALHHAARHRVDALVVEQTMFLMAGVWLWLSAFGGVGVDRGGRAWAGVASLLFTSIHMTLLGALFALAPRALYAGTASVDAAALADQHLGGGIMLLVGGASYLAGSLWLALTGLTSGPAAPVARSSRRRRIL